MSKNIKIGLVGVGGGGSNSVINVYDELASNPSLNIDYAIVNTDEQALLLAGRRRITKISLGDTTAGHGAGANPEVGYISAEQSLHKLEPIFRDKDIIFISIGLGGGTGSGAAPVIIKEANRRGILTIVFGTFPWKFEGEIRERNARRSLNSMFDYADSIFIINNDFLNDDQSMLIHELFKKTDTYLKYAILTISILILERSIINIDFQDIKTALTKSKFGFFFLSETNLNEIEKTDPLSKANAIYEKLCELIIQDLSLKDSKWMVVNISGTETTLSMSVINKVFEKIRQNSPKIQIIFGLSFNEYIGEGIVQFSGLYTNAIYGFNNISDSIDVNDVITPPAIEDMATRTGMSIDERYSGKLKNKKTK